jgi:hypothetical protein
MLNYSAKVATKYSFPTWAKSQERMVFWLWVHPSVVIALGILKSGYDCLRRRQCIPGPLLSSKIEYFGEHLFSFRSVDIENATSNCRTSECDLIKKNRVRVP